MRGVWRISRDLERLSDLVPLHEVDRPPGKGLECLAKNPVLELAEAKLNSLPNEKRELFLRGLIEVRDVRETKERLDRFMALLDEFQLLRGSLAFKHVRDDWFQSYFSPEAVDIAVTAGIVATQRALASQLPIDCYWVAGPAEDGMRYAITESSFQVNVLLITPKVVGRDTAVRVLDRPERIWFTAKNQDGEVIVVQNSAVAVER